MSRWMVAVALLGLSGLADAEDLLCKGNTWVDGQRVDESRILHADFQRQIVSINTANGAAEGSVKISDTTYVGSLHATNGRIYTLNLDRYSGEVFLVPMPPSGHLEPGVNLHAEFTGVCNRAQPKF